MTCVSYRRRIESLLLCAALAAAASVALCQAPPTPQGGGTQTWADQQRSQAWATQKLSKSSRRNEWVTMSNPHRDDTGFHPQMLKAWVDYPDVQGKVPVVLVLHEVFGLTDSTRNTADEIAAMGYIVITPDMLSGFGPNGGDTSSFPTTRAASNLITALKEDLMSETLDVWADYADKLPGSNGKLAVVGLSWGAGAAFRYATAATPRSDLKAVCVFYGGGLPAKDPALSAFLINRIRVPIYGFYASLDTRVIATLQATTDAMKAAGKTYDPVVYRNADHAFMRVGESPTNKNPDNVTAVSAALPRLEKVFKDAFR
jgi:carboxymethylenebutenolidase